MKLLILVGTRPNFIKVTQFKRVAKEQYPKIDIKIVHTGQHYSENMADIFFRQFNMWPDHYLDIDATTPSSQIAQIMLRLETYVISEGKPDLILVPGDVNSTLAGALFANKAGIPLGHIEAGLRSFDRTMPEEFNRCLTDEVTDLFFVSEPSGVNHLLSENRSKEKVHLVGNTMIDTMIAFEKEIDVSDILNKLNLNGESYVLMTMHRPATVDNKDAFGKLVQIMEKLSEKYAVVFPVHPRTVKQAKDFGLYERLTRNVNVKCTEPLDYFSFQKLIKECAFIITDSGGIQEESTFRKKPCLTLRPNTERPVTVDKGTNTLVPFEMNAIFSEIHSIEAGTYKAGSIPEYWDGRSTERILEVIASL